MENPNDYKHSTENKIYDIESLYSNQKRLLSESEIKFIEQLVHDTRFCHISSEKELTRLLTTFYKKTDINGIRKNKILVYLRDNGLASLEKYNKVIPLLVKKSKKSQSGVLVITVVTSPNPGNEKDPKAKFSCKWDCHYCPKEPGQPRSYLHDEPSVLRANQNNFDPVLQFTSRCLSLYNNGHPIDKIELLVLGGTWDSYPIKYRETFVRDLYYAANTFKHILRREKYSLEIEQRINETTKCRIIGLTLETRPDCITPDNIRHYRELGCTRIQIGVQHTNDNILRKINRKCYTIDTKNAIQLLKNSGYKVDIHLMTQLPGATPEIDEKMFMECLNHPDLQADQWKIYPCCVTPWTKIKEWYDKGLYKPYETDKLIELVTLIKPLIHPWIRLNRVFRDIPNQYIHGGTQTTNLRQVLLERMKKKGQRCRCIRCREVGNPKCATNFQYVERPYLSSGGKEIFMSFEDNNLDLIAGFLRLRLPPNNCQLVYQSHKNSAFIRELHVYGNLLTVHQNGSGKDIQHRGFGKKLLKTAEWIAWNAGYSKILVISGIGTRKYYEKLGYRLTNEGGYMVKEFKIHVNNFYKIIFTIIICIILLLISINNA